MFCIRSESDFKVLTRSLFYADEKRRVRVSRIHRRSTISDDQRVSRRTARSREGIQDGERKGGAHEERGNIHEETLGQFPQLEERHRRQSRRDEIEQTRGLFSTSRRKILRRRQFESQVGQSQKILSSPKRYERTSYQKRNRA